MSRKSRTMIERAASIFEYLDRVYLDAVQTPISKSNFQEIGFSPREMDKWLELIIFVQSMPRISLAKRGHRTYVEVLENKFMTLMKRRFFNTQATYEEREAAIHLYFKVLLSTERIRGEDVDMQQLIDEPPRMDRPTIKRIAEDAIAELLEAKE